MTEQQMALIQEAGRLHDNPDPAKHAAVRKRVLAVKLSPEQTLAKAEELGKAAEDAPDEVAKADAARERVLFRAWMRIQAAAEQEEMFRPTPRQQSVKLAEKGE